MKVAKLYSVNDIRIEDVPIPEIGPRDALIKTRACGICSGDTMPWYIEKKAPLVLGHEPVGEIVELGKELFNASASSCSPVPFSLGDRVFVHHHAPCMTCRYCRRGSHVQCETWRSTRIIPGGISEYILIPEINLRNDTLTLPDEMSYEDGTLVEPTACVVKSFSRSAIKKGDTILIIGLGVMGQLHILLARRFGAEKVIGADSVRFRLNKALQFGADHVVDVSKSDLLDKIRGLTGGKMADVVIVGPNSAAAMRQGIELASRGGTVVLFTPAKPEEDLRIDPNFLYFRDVSLVPSYSCGPIETRT
ncbi:MAG TPA: zinc-binding dehydrogenase, partial [Thermodesulfovibrionales bacterium]|nr:zinc-binding dehydrogenase [Thermodesulfovibrionales bacterium]